MLCNLIEDEKVINNKKFNNSEQKRKILARFRLINVIDKFKNYKYKRKIYRKQFSYEKF